MNQPEQNELSDVVTEFVPEQLRWLAECKLLALCYRIERDAIVATQRQVLGLIDRELSAGMKQRNEEAVVT